MESRVSDWMTPNPVTMREDDAALEAFDCMVGDGIRHIPVVDATSQVIGILSLDDLRAAFPVDVSLRRNLKPDERRQLLEYSVSDAMTWLPKTTRASATLEEAARELAEHRIGCLPVVAADETLIGILSEIDVMRGLVAKSTKERGPAQGAAESSGLADEFGKERGRLADQLDQWKRRKLNAEAGTEEEARDSKDRVCDDHEVARLEAMAERASRRLRAIEAAIERGDFGVCVRCGNAIATSRLRALPEATLCGMCARGEWDEPRFSRR